MIPSEKLFYYLITFTIISSITVFFSILFWSHLLFFVRAKVNLTNFFTSEALWSIPVWKTIL